MTRINCVPVEELSNAHLMAEYREITRVSKLARSLDDYGEYKMGTGHVKFFYNKGLYLNKRTSRLHRECKRRGFSVQQKEYVYHEEGLNNDWLPTLRDLTINRRRIAERIAANPEHHEWKIIGEAEDGSRSKK